MAKGSFPRLPTLSRVPASKENAPIQRVLDSQQQALRELIDVEILKGRLIEGVSLVNGETTIVKHGLGREARGYLIVAKDAPVTGDYLEISPRSKSEIHITSASDATVSLWVF